MAESKAFSFLDLPAEIRTKIYDLICYTHRPIPLTIFSPLSWNTYPHAFLLTSLQIYQEIRPVYFSINTFVLTIHRSNLYLMLHTLLSPDFASQRKLIRSLIVVIDRWGSKGFWVSKLVPVIEDMILNGRLRVLKVLMREGYLERGRQWLKGDILGLEDGAGEGANYVALRRLLGDPYLEVARLITYGAKIEDVEWAKDCEVDTGGRIEFDVGMGRLEDVTAAFLENNDGQPLI